VNRCWILSVALIAALGACSSDDDDTGAAQETAAPTAAESTAPSAEPGGLPASCTPAADADVQAITAGLEAGAVRLGEAFTATQGPYRYVTANVYDAADGRLSSADTWALDAAGVYAVSSSANDYSAFPDAGDVLASADVSVGHEVTGTQTECIIAAGQIANTGTTLGG
jgi:hypothetical protein